MNKPLISIIIPLYNKGKYIERTLNSILTPKNEDVEIIVVDDGSTDDSVKVVENINCPLITLIKKNNGGPSSARNEGVKYSSGSWILFLDADDIILPNSIDHFKELIMHNYDCNVFVANYYIKKQSVFKPHSLFIKSGIVKNNFRSWFWENLSPCQGASLYKKEVLLKYPYPEELRRWEDACMFFQIMRTEKIYLSSMPVFVYILDNSNASLGLNDISKDFLGHLSIKGKNFWEKMCVMLLLNQAKQIYPSESKLLYGKNFVSLFDNCIFNLLYIIKIFLRIISKIINTASKYRKC